MLPVEWCWWWWERLVLGLWMLVTLVLVKSYSGNLMSLLAVRYLPQPFQTLRDVLDALHVTMIGQKDSNFEQNLRVSFLFKVKLRYRKEKAFLACQNYKKF